MNKWGVLFCALFFLTAPCLAQYVTVNATIVDAGGNPATSGTVVFSLQPQGNGILYYIQGVGTIVPQTVTCAIQADGTLKNATSTGACLVAGNDIITPQNTLYQAKFYPNKVLTNTVGQLMINTSASPYNLNNPIFGPVVAINPQYQTLSLGPAQANVIPGANSTFTLGDAGHHWSVAYIDNIFGTATVTNLFGGNVGSIPYQCGVGLTCFISPNTTTTRKLVVEQGTGTAGQAPILDTLQAADIAVPQNVLYTSSYASLNAAVAACSGPCTIKVNNATILTANLSSSTAVIEVNPPGTINQGTFTYALATSAPPTYHVFLGTGAVTTPGNRYDYAGWWGYSSASSDNTAAVNTALIAAASIPIPLVFIPSQSSYRFNGTITPPNNSIMQCDTIHAGLNAWGVSVTGCIFDFHLTNSVGFLLQNNLYNVKIQGFEFSGKNSTGTSDAMNLGNDPSGATTVQQVYIQDNIFRDWPRYAVHHTGNVFEVWYERNTMENPDNASSDFMHVDSHTNSQIYLTDDVFLNFTDGTWAWNDVIGTTDLIVTRGIVSSSNAAAASGFAASGGFSLFGTHFEGGSKDGGVNPTTAFKIIGNTNGGQFFPSAVGGYNYGLWNAGTSVGITAGGPINGITYALLNDHGCQRCILTSDPGGVIHDTAGSSANRWIIPSLLIQATNPNTFTAIQTITLGAGSGVSAGSGMGLFVNSDTAIGMEVSAATGQQAYIDQCVGTNCWRHLHNPTDNTFRHFYNGVSKFVFDTSGNFNAVGNVQGVTVTTGSSIVYRCTSGGTLPAGALTTLIGNCGTTQDTGLRVQ